MLNTIFSGLFDTGATSVISVGNFLLCMACSLMIGVLLTFMYLWRTQISRSFAATLALLPAAVCAVIMMVNGNIGAGVAVAGAFSLVRFRSVPGSGEEIGALLIAMAAGLLAGMGYLAYALLFALILGGAGMALRRVGPLLCRRNAAFRTLRITIPEDLDYTGVFDDVFAAYTVSHRLVSVKTTNMGSMFKLTYEVTLTAPELEKKLMDALRCRNGNLEIALSPLETTVSEL
jgi:hypothetical protein